MVTREDFLREVAIIIESWTDSTVEALSVGDEDVGWREHSESWKRVREALATSEVPTDDVHNIVSSVATGIVHSLFAALDGATGLADKGLVDVVNEDGESLGRYMHEVFMDYLPNEYL